MKKENLKTVETAEKVMNTTLAAKIHISYELKQEGKQSVYNALGKLVEREFANTVDSKWMGAEFYDHTIEGDEITDAAAAKILRRFAVWAKETADILDPEDEESSKVEESK